MSSYLSNLLTQTTTRYNSIRRTLLSNEDDGDTEDDSHISRVLRAYYTEKGRPFPPWLPPDPNDKRAITPQPYSQPSGSYYGSNPRPQFNNVQSSQSQRSSLSDLWDPPAQAQAPMQPQSLRNARRPVAPQQPSTSSSLAPRPLPSQRAGSYQSLTPSQSNQSHYDQTPPPSSGGTAQDRLKARLWGGAGGTRSASPGNSQGPYTPPPSNTGNPYDNRPRYGR